MIALTKLSETATKITLGWTPVPGAIGYRFQSASSLKWSHTWDPNRSQVQFSKAAWYKVEALGVEDAGQYPSAPEPQPGDLLFPEAVLSNPIRITIPVTTLDFRLPDSTVGKDVLVDLERKPRQGVVVYDSNAGPPRNVHYAGSYFRCTAPRGSGSAYRYGGLRLQTKAQHVSITDYFKESFGVTGDTSADGLGLACGAHTKVTLQRALIEMPKDSQEPSEHIDCVQIQGPIGALEIGLATFFLAGTRPPNHYGKGLQLDELAWNGTPGPFPVVLRKVDFESLGVPGTSRSGMHIVQGTRRIAISFDEVYAAADDGENSLDFPSYVYVHNGSAADAPAVTGARPNRVSTWPNAATNIRGQFRERLKGTHFVTRAMLGV